MPEEASKAILQTIADILNRADREGTAQHNANADWLSIFVPLGIVNLMG